jgi:polyphosphate kinase
VTDWHTKPKKLKKQVYEAELARLQLELVKLQYWVKEKGLHVVALFEGRDAAGKGGTIQRIVEPLNPRGATVVALGTPTEREKTQWYFQRYIAHLPAAGEMVFFDRSWYNRAGVERVMGFCTQAQYQEFLRACPEFERMLVRSGIILRKYWFSVSDEEQERRFQQRSADPTKRWKLSPMDIKSRELWVEYSKAKDVMFAHTHTPEAPWNTVESDDKKRARLNCIAHLLDSIDYHDVLPGPIELGERASAASYDRPPKDESTLVPQRY